MGKTKEEVGTEMNDFLSTSLDFLKGPKKNRNELLKKAQKALQQSWTFPKLWNSKHPEALAFARATLDDESHKINYKGTNYVLIFIPFTLFFEASSGRLMDPQFGEETKTLAEKYFVPGTIVGSAVLDFDVLQTFNPCQVHELLTKIVFEQKISDLDCSLIDDESNIRQCCVALAVPSESIDDVYPMIEAINNRDSYEEWMDQLQFMFKDIESEIDVQMTAPGLLHDIVDGTLLSKDLLEMSRATEAMIATIEENKGGSLFVNIILTWAAGIQGPMFRVVLRADDENEETLATWENPIHGGGSDYWTETMAQLIEMFNDFGIENIQIENKKAEDFHQNWLMRGGLYTTN